MGAAGADTLRRSNHAICNLHESQRISLPSWRRGFRDNRKSQMATMAHPKPKSANQQSLIEEVSVLDFPEFNEIKGRKRRSKFERMPKVASQDARRVLEGKPKVTAAAAAAATAAALSQQQQPSKMKFRACA